MSSMGDSASSSSLPVTISLAMFVTTIVLSRHLASMERNYRRKHSNKRGRQRLRQQRGGRGGERSVDLYHHHGDEDNSTSCSSSSSLDKHHHATYHCDDDEDDDDSNMYHDDYDVYQQEQQHTPRPSVYHLRRRRDRLSFDGLPQQQQQQQHDRLYDNDEHFFTSNSSNASSPLFVVDVKSTPASTSPPPPSTLTATTSPPTRRPTGSVIDALDEYEPQRHSQKKIFRHFDNDVNVNVNVGGNQQKSKGGGKTTTRRITRRISDSNVNNDDEEQDPIMFSRRMSDLEAKQHYMDFHPKNRNWSHFEEYSNDEHDGVVVNALKDGDQERNDDGIKAAQDKERDMTKRGNVVDDKTAMTAVDDAEESFVWTSRSAAAANRTALRKCKADRRASDGIGMNTEKARRDENEKIDGSTNHRMESDLTKLAQDGLEKVADETEDGRGGGGGGRIKQQLRRISHLLRSVSGGLGSFMGADDEVSYVGQDSNDEDEENSYAGDERDAIVPPTSSSSSLHDSHHHRVSSAPFNTDSSRRKSSRTYRRSAPRRSSSDPSLFASINDVEMARVNYNARIMPSKVVMIRHGQSEGNVNETLYATKPDNAMRLTRLGWDQSRMAGRALREAVLEKGESVHFIVSPYVRTVETFHGLVSAWCDPSEFEHIENRDERVRAWYGRLLEMGLTWHEDPRIREQDFGNYQDPVTMKKCKRERHKFGVFYYRFPHGESASDVFDRVSTFLDSLWRSFDLQRSRNYVLVTHGISIRVLLARYFRYSIDQFNMLANPKNCEMVVLGHDGAGRLRLEGRCDLQVRTTQSDLGDDKNASEVIGYMYHKRLRVLPKEWIEKRRIRVSYDDCIDEIEH